MSILHEGDREFVQRVLKYFGLKGVRLEAVSRPKHEISTDANPDVPTWFIGPKWQRRRRYSAVNGRAGLVHESLHSLGYPHDAEMRRRGFYSLDREKDSLTADVYKDIERGTPHFEPQRFGLPDRRSR